MKSVAPVWLLFVLAKSGRRPSDGPTVDGRRKPVGHQGEADG